MKGKEMRGRPGLYIPAYVDLPRHPKTLRLAVMLKRESDQVWPHLMLMWWWAIEFAPGGFLSVGGRVLDATEVASICHWREDATTWFEALVACNWIEKGGQDGTTLQLHDWKEFAGKLHMARAKHAASMREARATHVVCTCKHVPCTCLPETETERETERETKNTPLPPPSASPGRPTQVGEPALVGVGGEQAGEGISEGSGSAAEGMQGSEAEVERQLVQRALKVLVGVPATIRQYVGRWIVRVGAMRVEEMLASPEARKATALEVDRRLCPLPAAHPQQRARTAEEIMREQGFSEEEIVRQREEAEERQAAEEKRVNGQVAPSMREILGSVLKRADAGAPANGASTSDLQREALARLEAERERERERVCEYPEEGGEV